MWWKTKASQNASYLKYLKTHGRENKTVTEAQTNPLQIILDEFKTLSPETTSATVFNNDGQTIADTKTTTEDQTKKLIANFCSIALQSQTIGGVENLIIQAPDSQLTITSMNSLYLAMISSREANQEIVKSLTQVIVPTVAKLIDQKTIMPTETPPSPAIELEEKTGEKGVLPIINEPSVEPIIDPKTSFEPFHPSTPINQFMIEKIGGLLVPADIVRIDGEVIAKWSDLYGGKQILLVNIEALDGKKTTCKVKPIKDAKNNSKGVIQIPEKILQNLQTEKGKLVMVGPLIE